MQREGISPLLATVLLLAITVAGGALIYTIFFSQAGSTTPKINLTIMEAKYHSIGGNLALLTVSVKNEGATPVYVGVGTTAVGDGL